METVKIYREENGKGFKVSICDNDEHPYFEKTVDVLHIEGKIIRNFLNGFNDAKYEELINVG